MAILKCKMCGGELSFEANETVCECEYCGSKQTVPLIDDEKKVKLYERANKLRLNCEFDKAAGVYENIVADFSEDAEAYWGLILCTYGIEYVDDPNTGKKIPTCHRSSFDSVMDDANFEMVMENADSVARAIYREEAKVIEELRKGIIEISGKEEPYDIFICYKETDENGERTLDSVLAQDVYDELTAKGYKVFFSRITLEDKLGMEYEPYIFAALNSAKIMLAFGTSYDHYNAVWVKNEWSRYLKLMAQDKEKHLIPCFKGIDAYDIPKEFVKLQAQDMGKVGAIQDLVRGIEKIVKIKDDVDATPIMQTIVQSGGPNVESLIKRGYMAIEDKEWDSAKKFFDQVLNMNAECVEAYLGLALAERHHTTLKSLVLFGNIDNKNYQRARKYASNELLAELDDYEEKRRIRQAEEKERLEAEQKVKEEKERAEQKAEEEKKKAEDLKKQMELERTCKRCSDKRKQIENVQNLIAAGKYWVAGLKTDGTVIGTCNAEGVNIRWNLTAKAGWRDIVAISFGDACTVGLKSDGTVLAAGRNIYGECNVAGWVNIVAISAGSSHTIGLKTDGTVVAAGSSLSGACNVFKWRDIVAISAGSSHTIGLKTDGTVVAVGSNESGQCDVSGWRDIVAISTGSNHTIGLKTDGTVVAVGNNGSGQCDVSEWRDMVTISAGSSHTIGLKSDGTVAAVGSNISGQCFVSAWRDIVAISAGDSQTVGLKSDGRVLVANTSFDVYGWKLFHSLTLYEQEREEGIREFNYRSIGVCQHCGGDFKGFFTKTCTKCGRAKDY